MEDHLARAALINATLALCFTLGCDDGGEDEGELEPTLSAIQVEVFTPKCSLASCHSVDFHAGGLVLVEGMSHVSLAEPAVQSCAANEGLMRVSPGMPEASFLWVKLQPGLDSCYGGLMPAGSSTGLPAQELDAIRDWIDAGALDD